MPTLFDYNHLAQVILLWKMRKFICYCTVFALFYFEIEGHFQAQAPRGLYLEALILGILRYCTALFLITLIVFFSLTNLIGYLRTVSDIILKLNKSRDHRGQIVFPCRYHTYLEKRTQSPGTNTRKRTQFFQI